jgi:hypothetical protein
MPRTFGVEATSLGHTETLTCLVMSSLEKQAAQEVHELLLEARPQSGDASLARAAEITCTPDDPVANDSLRADVFVAIQRLRTAIALGASASDAEALLLGAIRAAERWVRKYPFRPQ